MGFWLTVGKLAASVGVRAVNSYARQRLEAKGSKARREGDQVEDAAFWAVMRRKQRREARERAKAAR
jgi:hypothetical protein